MQGAPGAQEFITKVSQELQEARAIRGDRAHLALLPTQARVVSCASASTYQGSTEPHPKSTYGPREWDIARVRPTATCLTACRTRLLRTSVS